MLDILGAPEYNSGDLEDLEGVVALDENTLEITLTNPLSYFDSILAFSTVHPVRLDVIALHGNEWTQPGNFVGNGAYVLVEHNPGENLFFEKNELYWDADNVQIERIEVSIIQEQVTSVLAFETGELDFTDNFPLQIFPDWH
jgi:oligopeptide transport system substrate-binding protein